MDWIATLNGLEGLSDEQKGTARAILLTRLDMAAAYVSGPPGMAVAAIKELLRREAAALAAQAAQVAHSAAAQAAAQTGAVAGLGPGSAAGAGAAAGLGLGSAAGLGAAAGLGLGSPAGAELAAAVVQGGAAAGQGGPADGPAGSYLSPTELLRSALPARKVHHRQGVRRCSTSSQAYDKNPLQVLRWEHVDPEEAGGGSGGGSGNGCRPLVEGICGHQDTADVLYGADRRLFRPASVGPLLCEADVSTAFVWSVTGSNVLDLLANAHLGDSDGTCATWYQQPPAYIIQCGVATGGGGEQGGGKYGWQQAAGSASAAAPSSSAASRSASGPRREVDRRCKPDLILLLEPRWDNSSSSLPQVDASAAGASAADQQGHGAGGEQQRPPEPAEAAAAAAETQRAGGIQGGGGSAGAGGNSLPVEEQAEVEADPAPKRPWRQPQCVCVGELKVILKLMDKDNQPVDLLAAWNSRRHAHYTLARGVMSQIYTYMIVRETCYGFISCWSATWLVYCPANNRNRLYLSDAFLATTTASAPGGSSAATAYSALAFLQWLALRSASRGPLLLQQGVDMPRTGLGPAADGGSDGGSGSSTDGPDAGADPGSDESYRPTRADLAAAQGTSSDSYHPMRGGQELRRAAAAAPEPASATAAQQPLAAAAAAPAAAANTAAVRQRPSRVLLRFQEELSAGSDGLVVAGTCDGVDCVIKLLGPDRSGLAAYEREVAAYAALEGLQGLHVPELLAWGDLDCGVRFLAVRRVAGGQPLSRLPRPIPAAVAAAAVRVLEVVQAACPGFVHGDVRLANMLAVQAGPPPPPAAAAGAGGGVGFGGGESGDGGGGGGGQASGTQLRCMLLDFGRSWLDGDAAQQRLELEQLHQLLAAVAAQQQQA